MTKATCMESLPYPTTSEMRWQKRTILQNARPRLLLWFGLHNTLGFVPRLEDPDQNHNQPTPAEAIVRAQRLGLAVRGKAGGTSRRNSAPKKRKGKRGAGRHGSGVGRGGSGR